MKHCDVCNVDVSTPGSLCPLCGASLCGEGVQRPAYPPVGYGRSYHFVRRLLMFFTIMTVAVCLVVNLAAGPKFWWWLVVATALVYLWAVVSNILRNGGSGGGRVLVQVLATSALVMLLDLQFGWHAWSVNYVVPAVCGAGIAAIMVLILCNLTNWARYVLYQVTLAALGFVPIALYFTGVANVFWPSAVLALLALASLVALALFGDKTIKNEFVRRLHL